MAKTTNLQLNKPIVSDVYDLALWNENSDILDSEVQSVKDRTTSLESGQDTLDTFKTSQETLNSTLIKGVGEKIQKGNGTVSFSNATSAKVTVSLSDPFINSSYFANASPTGVIEGSGYAAVFYRAIRTANNIEFHFATLNQAATTGNLPFTWVAIGK